MKRTLRILRIVLYFSFSFIFCDKTSFYSFGTEVYESNDFVPQVLLFSHFPKCHKNFTNFFVRVKKNYCYSIHITGFYEMSVLLKKTAGSYFDNKMALKGKMKWFYGHFLNCKQLSLQVFYKDG